MFTKVSYVISATITISPFEILHSKFEQSTIEENFKVFGIEMDSLAPAWILENLFF